MGISTPLNERILGIDVFKPPHDYDTGADPVVRITAGEVRRRIALYYHETGTQQELRIELPAGSCVPVLFPALSPNALLDSRLPTLGSDEPIGVSLSQLKACNRLGARGTHAEGRTWIVASALIIFLGLVLAAGWHWTWTSSPLESMWRPFFNSPDQALIVVGSPLGALAGPTTSDAKLPMDSHKHVHLSFNDAMALTDIAGLLEVHGRPYRVQASWAASLDDLRKRSVVLIAAFGDSCSDASSPSSIRPAPAAGCPRRRHGSRQHRRPPASGIDVELDFAKPVTVNSRDYAIVARLRSDFTEVR